MIFLPSSETPPAPKLRLTPISAAALVAAIAAAIGGGLGAVAVAGPTANSDTDCHDFGENTDCIVVMIDHLTRVQLEGEAKTVLIGNPAVADVTMVSKTHAIITARTVGATNLIFLGETGDTIGDYEIVVRETEQRRVVLRRGPSSTELYQCAPRCERTLTQLDSDTAHESLSAQIDRETRMNSDAAGEPGDDSAE